MVIWYCISFSYRDHSNFMTKMVWSRGGNNSGVYSIQTFKKKIILKCFKILNYFTSHIPNVHMYAFKIVCYIVHSNKSRSTSWKPLPYYFTVYTKINPKFIQNNCWSRNACNDQNMDMINIHSFREHFNLLCTDTHTQDLHLAAVFGFFF